MSSECGVCGRPTPDNATVCPRCAHVLDADIADVAAPRGLAYDLDIALGRRTHTALTATEVAEEKRAPGVLPANPLPYNPRASAVAGELARVLRRWAYVVKDGTGDTYPPRRMVDLAGWLRPRVGWLRHHEAGADAYEQITGAVHEARRVIDRPADKLYAGPCDECGRDLYAGIDAAYVRCGNVDGHEGGDEWVWSVVERRRWLLDSARDVLATTTEISRALARYQGKSLTTEAIRGYVKRGRLTVRGHRPDGGRKVPLYRLGDMLDILDPSEKVAS
jgi:hypothetical protein